MMRQELQQARPGRGRADMGPAIGRTVPLNPGFAAVRTRPLYGAGQARVQRDSPPDRRAHVRAAASRPRLLECLAHHDPSR